MECFSTSRSVSLVVALTLALAGCGPPKVVPVNGHVQFMDGGDPAPLAGYVVTFEPGEKLVGGTGEVRPDGTFAISTFGENDGAVPGQHRVALTPPRATEGGRASRVIDARYGSLETSGLTAEIIPQRKPVEITLKVERLK